MLFYFIKYMICAYIMYSVRFVHFSFVNTVFMSESASASATAPVVVAEPSATAASPATQGAWRAKHRRCLHCKRDRHRLFARSAGACAKTSFSERHASFLQRRMLSRLQHRQQRRRATPVRVLRRRICDVFRLTGADCSPEACESAARQTTDDAALDSGCRSVSGRSLSVWRVVRVPRKVRVFAGVWLPRVLAFFCVNLTRARALSLTATAGARRAPRSANSSCKTRTSIRTHD